MKGLSKYIESLLSWIFPTPKESKEDKIIETITKYFLIVNDVPYDNYRIEFSNERWVQISLIYNRWEDAYHSIQKENNLEKDMGDMFPYRFTVNCSVSAGEYTIKSFGS